MSRELCTTFADIPWERQVCCSVLPCVAVCCTLYQESCVRLLQTFPGRGRCVGACCSVFQYVAVFIKRAVCDFCRHSLGDWRGRYVAACCGVLQCVAVCCSVLQCKSGEVCVTFADILLEKQVYCNVAVCCCTLQLISTELCVTFADIPFERSLSCSVL
jgi:hypothetical protein